MSLREILKPFEHTPSLDENYLFGEEILPIAERIRAHYKMTDYDHRPFLPEKADPKKFPWVWTDEFRIGQACFKYAVAKVLKPKYVYEIGVGAGISAMAFIHGFPGFRYYGVDMDTHESFYDLSIAEHLITDNMSKTPIFIRADSTRLKILPRVRFDLAHIDGGHDFETAKSDMRLVWNAGAKWILVDDANDAAVVAGVFSAIHELPHGKTDYAYFENTWSGNLLFRRT